MLRNNTVSACGSVSAVSYVDIQSRSSDIPPAGITDTCVPFTVQINPAVLSAPSVVTAFPLVVVGTKEKGSPEDRGLFARVHANRSLFCLYFS